MQSKGDDFKEYNPWGRPGGGAPIRTQSGNVVADYKKLVSPADYCTALLRADVRNYRESGVSREISNFFIFCSSNLYSEVFSKTTLKVSTAFYFFRNRAKFQNTAYRPPSNSETGGK